MSSRENLPTSTIPVEQGQALSVNGNGNKLLPNSKKLKWQTYLLYNKDLIPHLRTEEEAILHYEKHGKSEGRLASTIEFYDRFPYFNSELYRKSHQDLSRLNREELMSHYWYNGRHEHRIAYSSNDISKSIPHFDVEFYRQHYSNLKNLTDSELFTHYLDHGRVQNLYKNRFELELSQFLSAYDHYAILFTRIEDVLSPNGSSPIIFQELDAPVRDIESDLYSDLVTELARFNIDAHKSSALDIHAHKSSGKGSVAVLVVDFYADLRTDEYRKNYSVNEGVNTIFYKTHNDSSGVGHMYIRSQCFGVIDRLVVPFGSPTISGNILEGANEKTQENPSFIFVRGNNVPMIQRIGAIFKDSCKIFYPATSPTFKNNKYDRNTVQYANYQLYEAAQKQLPSLLPSPVSQIIPGTNTSGTNSTDTNTYHGYDVILVDDKFLLDYLLKTSTPTSSKLVLFTKYAVQRPNMHISLSSTSLTTMDTSELKVKGGRYDLLYTSYTKGPTKNFSIFMEFVRYLAVKKSDLKILFLNKENNDDIEELRKIGYPYMDIVLTSTPDKFYELCNNHLITSGRDAQPRTISETLSKGVHNIVLDTLTNGLDILRHTKIFGTIIPTRKVYKSKHYVPVGDVMLYNALEIAARVKNNPDKIRKLAADLLSRERILLDLIPAVYWDTKYIVTFATIDYSNMLSLLLNSIYTQTRNRDINGGIITVVFCLNWKKQHRDLFMQRYKDTGVLFVPHNVPIRSKNDILKVKVNLIKDCYTKLNQDFIWVDADSIILKDLTPLYDIFEQNRQQILVLQRPEAKTEYEKVALGVLGIAKHRLSTKDESLLIEDPILAFLKLWSQKVEQNCKSTTDVAVMDGVIHPNRAGATSNNTTVDWFADQIGFYQAMKECQLLVHSLTGEEHSINGNENTIIYSRRRHNKRSITDVAMDHGIDADILTIPGIQYAYVDQTVDHYSIFFVTYDFPSNGGAATNLYSIYKLYKQLGVTCCIAFITEQHLPYPLLHEFKSDPNIFVFKPDAIDLSKPKFVLQQKKFKVLIFKIYKTLSSLEQQGLSLSYFKKIIYLCSGLSTYEPLSSRNSDSYNQKRLDELYPIQKSHKVLFNSSLTHKLFLQMLKESNILGLSGKGNRNETISVLNTTLLGMDPQDFAGEVPAWKDRKIDLIYIVSDCNRRVKNAEIIYHLYRRPDLNHLKKVIIGLNCDPSMIKVPNTTVISTNLARQQVLQHLRHSKILILPSLFDSSPNILYEALLSGCNVIASSNIGNVEILPASNVVKLTHEITYDTARFASLLSANLEKIRCQAPVITAERRKILNDLVLLD
jgi:glycosyltransferase involved in cell wall biosynthesis